MFTTIGDLLLYWKIYVMIKDLRVKNLIHVHIKENKLAYNMANEGINFIQQYLESTYTNMQDNEMLQDCEQIAKSYMSTSTINGNIHEPLGWVLDVISRANTSDMTHLYTMQVA